MEKSGHEVKSWPRLIAYSLGCIEICALLVIELRSRQKSGQEFIYKIAWKIYVETLYQDWLFENIV